MAHSASLALASPSRKGVLPKDLLFGTLFKLRMNIMAEDTGLEPVLPMR